MRRLFWILLILIVSTAVADEQLSPEEIGFGVENAKDLGITNPKIVSSLDLGFSESGVFDIVPQGKDLSKLNLKLFSYPRNDYYLDISQTSTSPSANLEDDYYSFGWQNVLVGNIEYSLSSKIKMDFDIKKVSSQIQFPFSDVPDEYQIYLQPSEKINSDDPDIKRLSNELILGESDAYVVAYKLAKYVSDEMTYDLSYLGKIEPASKVVQDKTGVCVEYANLFMALARSVGIPARYVSGYAYGNVYGEKFNAHAWTEIWLPDVGWIPVDPTFGEFGWVDMTHIKTQVSEGPEEPSLRYSWSGGDVSTTEPSIRVDLQSKKEDLPDFVVNDMWVEKDEIGFGSYNVIWMSVENTQNFYLSPDAFLTAAPKILGKNQKSTILKPGEKSRIGWVVELPKDLDSDFVYTYTLNGGALFGDDNTAEFVVNPKSDEVISLEDAQDLLGVEDLKVSTNQYDADLNINLNYPRVAYVDEAFEISVDIYNSGNAPIDKLNICVKNQNSDCETVFLGINDHQVLTFSETANVEGSETFSVTMQGDDIQEEQTLTIQVEKRNIFEKVLLFFSNLFSNK